MNVQDYKDAAKKLNKFISWSLEKRGAFYVTKWNGMNIVFVPMPQFNDNIPTKIEFPYNPILWDSPRYISGTDPIK